MYQPVTKSILPIALFTSGIFCFFNPVYSGCPDLSQNINSLINKKQLNGYSKTSEFIEEAVFDDFDCYQFQTINVKSKLSKYKNAFMSNWLNEQHSPVTKLYPSYSFLGSTWSYDVDHSNSPHQCIYLLNHISLFKRKGLDDNDPYRAAQDYIKHQITYKFVLEKQ